MWRTRGCHISAVVIIASLYTHLSYKEGTNWISPPVIISNLKTSLSVWWLLSRRYLLSRMSYTNHGRNGWRTAATCLPCCYLVHSNPWPGSRSTMNFKNLFVPSFTHTSTKGILEPEGWNWPDPGLGVERTATSPSLNLNFVCGFSGSTTTSYHPAAGPK